MRIEKADEDRYQDAAQGGDYLAVGVAGVSGITVGSNRLKNIKADDGKDKDRNDKIIIYRSDTGTITQFDETGASVIH